MQGTLKGGRKPKKGLRRRPEKMIVTGQLNPDDIDCLRIDLLVVRSLTMYRPYVRYAYPDSGNWNVLSQVKSVINEQRPTVSTTRTLLLHDNAGLHKARATTQSLWDPGVKVLPQPAYSPDLAP
ncbi:transposase [Elysia marginata]|uniref:Transposase n=1 Tax=Elysia marginata TaxID=1093978 RepID=A0AAV4GNB9_9GAST|nr:transposase [Elysia marginata]